MAEPNDDRRRQQDLVIRAALSRIQKTYLIMSGKGGVGKSSLAANLAASAADAGSPAGLLDVDLHGPSIPRMLGLPPDMTVGEDGTIKPQRFSENLSVVSIEGMMKDKDEAIIWRGPRKLNAIRQFLSDVNWGDLEYLFIDSPPGTGDEPLAVAQNAPGAAAIVVTTPQEVSLADVRKSIRFLSKVGLKIAGIIENMSGFICPHCGERTDLFGRGGGRLMAEALDLNFLGAVPLDPDVVAASDRGWPLVLDKPDADFSKAVRKIAAKL
jgi:Mrp family chromosome partitioning ATPase